MLCEYQILYRVGKGPVLTVSVLAGSPEEARRLLTETADHRPPTTDFTVLGIGPGVPFVDWAKPYFNKSEAAAYVTRSEAHLDDLMARGELPRPKNGFPIFPRAVLDALVRKRMDLEKWEREQKREAA